MNNRFFINIIVLMAIGDFQHNRVGFCRYEQIDRIAGRYARCIRRAGYGRRRGCFQ